MRGFHQTGLLNSTALNYENNMKKQVLIFFLKYPRPGKVKTRLGAEIGFDEACRLYEAFIHDACRKFSKLDQQLIFAVTPNFSIGKYKSFLGKKHKIFFQRGKDLGEKMFNAFKYIFSIGAESAILTGSDLPALTADIISKAFTDLESCDACIGPAKDGGYYLIGFRAEKLTKNVFEDISWSTDSVLKTTLEKMDESSLKPAKLPEIADVDNLQDLIELSRTPGFSKLCPETARVYRNLKINLSEIPEN